MCERNSVNTRVCVCVCMCVCASMCVSVSERVCTVQPFPYLVWPSCSQLIGNKSTPQSTREQTHPPTFNLPNIHTCTYYRGTPLKKYPWNKDITFFSHDTTYSPSHTEKYQKSPPNEDTVHGPIYTDKCKTPPLIRIWTLCMVLATLTSALINTNCIISGSCSNNNKLMEILFLKTL